jgi:hypothetical protein
VSLPDSPCGPRQIGSSVTRNSSDQIKAGLGHRSGPLLSTRRGSELKAPTRRDRRPRSARTPTARSGVPSYTGFGRRQGRHIKCSARLCHDSRLHKPPSRRARIDHQTFERLQGLAPAIRELTLWIWRDVARAPRTAPVLCARTPYEKLGLDVTSIKGFPKHPRAPGHPPGERRPDRLVRGAIYLLEGALPKSVEPTE